MRCPTATKASCGEANSIGGFRRASSSTGGTVSLGPPAFGSPAPEQRGEQDDRADDASRADPLTAEHHDDQEHPTGSVLSIMPAREAEVRFVAHNCPRNASTVHPSDR